jgi:hypothetical protein
VENNIHNNGRGNEIYEFSVCGYYFSLLESHIGATASLNPSLRGRVPQFATNEKQLIEALVPVIKALTHHNPN